MPVPSGLRLLGLIMLGAVRQQRVPIVAFFAGAVALLLGIRFAGLAKVGEAWERFDTLLGILTFGVAIVVWYGEAREDWEEARPKRLSAVFLHASRPVMICENAVLVSEDDIRPWAQQLGAQMAEVRQLAFAPFLILQEPRLVWEGDTLCRLYEIHLFLRVVPDRVMDFRALCGPKAFLAWQQEGPHYRETIRTPT